jgi:hypothetical protein
VGVGDFLSEDDEVDLGLIEFVLVCCDGRVKSGSWWVLGPFTVADEDLFGAVRGVDMDSTLVKWLRVIEGRGRASCAVGGISSAAGPGRTRFDAFVLLLSQCLVFQRPASQFV